MVGFTARYTKGADSGIQGECQEKTQYTQLYIQITSWCYANPSVWFAEISGSDFFNRATIAISSQVEGFGWKYLVRSSPDDPIVLCASLYIHMLPLFDYNHYKMTYCTCPCITQSSCIFFLQTCLTSPAGSQFRKAHYGEEMAGPDFHGSLRGVDRWSSFFFAQLHQGNP